MKESFNTETYTILIPNYFNNWHNAEAITFNKHDLNIGFSNHKYTAPSHMKRRFSHETLYC